MGDKVIRRRDRRKERENSKWERERRERRKMSSQSNSNAGSIRVVLMPPVTQSCFKVSTGAGMCLLQRKHTSILKYIASLGPLEWE